MRVVPTDMEERLAKITDAVNVANDCRLTMMAATNLDDRMNNFLGYMDFVREVSRLLYEYN